MSRVSWLSVRFNVVFFSFYEIQRRKTVLIRCYCLVAWHVSQSLPSPITVMYFVSFFRVDTAAVAADGSSGSFFVTCAWMFSNSTVRCNGAKSSWWDIDAVAMEGVGGGAGGGGGGSVDIVNSACVQETVEEATENSVCSTRRETTEWSVCFERCHLRFVESRLMIGSSRRFLSSRLIMLNYFLFCKHFCSTAVGRSLQLNDGCVFQLVCDLSTEQETSDVNWHNLIELLGINLESPFEQEKESETLINV